MRVLVTGCAGFIGWKVTEKLLMRGDTVIGVDNMNDYYDPRLKQWRLDTLKDFEEFVFHKDDITDRPRVEELFKEAGLGGRLDAVINLAAQAGVRASVEQPWLYYETNVTGTLNLLEGCRRHGVKKFLLASTSSVYGLNKVPFREIDPSDRVLSPYSASKKGAEVLCHTYHYLYDMDVVIPRYFSVYGPAGRPDMSIPRFMKAIREGIPIQVYGDGTQKRDFTYVDDIADATVRALELRGYSVLNLGNSNPIEINSLIRLIESNLGRKAIATYLPRHPADVEATWAEVDRARQLLDWKPKVQIEQGIRETVKWYEKYLETTR